MSSADSTIAVESTSSAGAKTAAPSDASQIEDVITSPSNDDGVAGVSSVCDGNSHANVTNTIDADGASAPADVPDVTPVTPPWRVGLNIGHELDVLDNENNWCTSTVIRADVDRVCVRYHNSGEEYDEWILRDSHRLAIRASRAPYVEDTEATAAAKAHAAAASNMTVQLNPVDSVQATWQSNLKLGDVLEACDLLRVWHTGTVVDCGVHFVRVRFQGRHDSGEWFQRTCDRLRPSQMAVIHADLHPLPPVPVFRAGEKWRGELTAGSLVDMQGTAGGTWSCCVVVEATSHMVWVKYHGWSVTSHAIALVRESVSHSLCSFWFGRAVQGSQLERVASTFISALITQRLTCDRDS